MRYMVNGREVEYVTPDPDERCEWCGEWGHDYRRHGEAVREVEAFKQTELYRDQEDAKEAIIAAERRAARFGY